MISRSHCNYLSKKMDGYNMSEGTECILHKTDLDLFPVLLFQDVVKKGNIWNSFLSELLYIVLEPGKQCF